MLKNKLEALLFSSGRKMSVEELSKLSSANQDEIQNSLIELKEEYDEKNSSIMLINEGSSWKLTVREQYLPLVQKIVTETELSKTIMETLAIIALKYPIKQSNLIKIRTNKAYDHLKELEEMGYITRQKHGRTNLIKLTQKFFEYFDLSKEKLKDQFKDFQSIAKAIEEKERDIEAIKAEQKAKAEEDKQKDEKIKEEIDLLDEEEHKVPLKTYENEKKRLQKQYPEVVEEKEKLGNLEVTDEPSEEELERERERIESLKEDDKKYSEEKKEESQRPKFKGEGIKVSKDMEKIIDKKVEKILHPPKENESEEESKEEKKQYNKEPKDLLEASMEEKEEQESKKEKQ